MDTGTDNLDQENKTDEVIPAEDVKTPAEEVEATSQADTHKEEFYVEEEEGDQKKPNMSQEAAYAAFRKEQKKRKDKQKQIDAEKAEKEALKKELDDLKASVGKIEKGAPPTLESCGYDESLLNQKMTEYYSNPKPSEPASPEPDKASPVDDEAEFYLYQREKDLSEAVPGYEEAKQAAVSSLVAAGIEDTSGAMLYLSGIAKQKGVDIAKAILAIGKVPTIIGEIQRAGNNQILIADILEKAESRVKSRSKKAIDTEPEPNINNSGPIDNTSEKVKKLRDAWVKNPNKRNFDAYRAAKQG